MNTNALCPICGEGHVTNHIDQVEHEYRGTKTRVPMHYKTCTGCGSDFAGAEEIRLNKHAVQAEPKGMAAEWHPRQPNR